MDFKKIYVKIILLLILLTQGVLMGQTRNYVDSIVVSKHIASTTDYDYLADEITEPFKTDSEKVRAIFYWMTQNISYNYKAVGTYLPNLIVDYDFDEKAIIKTLKRKKGICNDYALVFKALCNREDIVCEKIEGYAAVEKPFFMLKFQWEENANHAWNVVRINNKWYLMDVTWATGGVNKKTAKAYREIDEKYYLTKPEILILDHHPSLSKWQLLNNPVTMRNFIEKARQTMTNIPLFNR